MQILHSFQFNLSKSIKQSEKPKFVLITLSEVPLDFQRVPVLHLVVVDAVQEDAGLRSLLKGIRHPEGGDLHETGEFQLDKNYSEDEVQIPNNIHGIHRNLRILSMTDIHYIITDAQTAFTRLTNIHTYNFLLPE